MGMADSLRKEKKNTQALPRLLIGMMMEVPKEEIFISPDMGKVLFSMSESHAHG
jgi:hypothetical protein